LTGPAPLRRDPAREVAHARFKEAVLALSDAPTASNLLRYLRASRELEAALARVGSENAA
jgi:hypothetical protein